MILERDLIATDKSIFSNWLNRRTIGFIALLGKKYSNDKRNRSKKQNIGKLPGGKD